MQEEISTTAAAIWQTLSNRSELSLARLKNAMKGKPWVFDWAIGWLTRKDKIVITQEKRTFPHRARRDEGKGGKTSAFVR